VISMNRQDGSPFCRIPGSGRRVPEWAVVDINLLA
jgi:hypothetical protein